LRAGNHSHPGFGLVEDKVDIFACAGEVAEERLDAGVEAHEIKPAVVIEFGWRFERERGAVEIPGISGGVRDSDELAEVVEGPRMVEALESLGVTLVEAADLGAPMRATIMEDADDAVLAANENQRAPSDIAPAIITRFLELRFVPDVEPASVEDTLALEREGLLRGHDGAMDAKSPALIVLDDKTADIHPRTPGGLEIAQ
jgi:hypothetical protein